MLRCVFLASLSTSFAALDHPATGLFLSRPSSYPDTSLSGEMRVLSQLQVLPLAELKVGSPSLLPHERRLEETAS